MGCLLVQTARSMGWQRHYNYPWHDFFFDWEDEEGGGLDSDADHVGIVERMENGRVYTIEGNTADSCRERSYPLGHFEVLDYGFPSY